MALMSQRWTVPVNRPSFAVVTFAKGPSVARFDGEFCDLAGDLVAFYAPTQEEGSLHVVDLGAPARRPRVFRRCPDFSMRVNLARRVIMVADAGERYLVCCKV